jgi:hypothetical protein
MRKSHLSLVISFTAFLSLLFSCPRAARAAAVIWGPATSLVTDSDVLSIGSQLLAYAWGINGGQTVHTVTLTQTSSMTSPGRYLSLGGFTALNSSTFADGNPIGKT